MTNSSDNLNNALSLFKADSSLMDGMASWDTPRRLAFVKTLEERGNVHAALAMREVGATHTPVRKGVTVPQTT